MTNQETILKFIETENIIRYQGRIRKQFPNIYIDIIEQYGDTFGQQLYNYIHDFTEIDIICPICNKNTRRFLGVKRGYSNTCSSKCSANSPETRKKYTDSMIEKYGSHFFASQIGKDKIKESNLINYGVQHHLSSSIVKNLIKQSVIEKYGVDNISQIPLVKNKIINTIQERYGVSNVSQIPKVKEKSKNTKLTNCSAIISAKKQKSTNIASGHWIDHDKFIDGMTYKQYKRKVFYLTNRNLKNKCMFQSTPRGQKQYHVDHKYSIKSGFENKIPPSIIANVLNLQMLDYRDNISKGSTDAITLAELLRQTVKAE